MSVGIQYKVGWSEGTSLSGNIEERLEGYEEEHGDTQEKEFR